MLLQDLFEIFQNWILEHIETGQSHGKAVVVHNAVPHPSAVDDSKERYRTVWRVCGKHMLDVRCQYVTDAASISGFRISGV